MGLSGTMPGMSPKDMTPEMVEEHKKEKEEQKEREVMNDALYALNSIQKLMVMDADRIAGNPKMVDLLQKVRDGIDALMSGTTTAPETPTVPETEPEEAEETEAGARKQLRGMGFGMRPGRGY